MQTLITDYGYLAVFVLMLAESACIPIPSEVTMLFAGAVAGGAVAGSHLSLAGIVVAGVAGNVAGSYLAWAVGRYGGLAAWRRWGRYVGLHERDLDAAQRWFDRHGNGAVFVGRLLPVVRTFISLPAGIARMHPARFGLYTTAGCIPWTLGLALAGYAVGDNWPTIAGAFHNATVVIAVLVVVAVAGAAVVLIRRRRRSGVPARESRSAAHQAHSPSAATGAALRVPQITAIFWLIKGLSTAVGESTSDFLVHAMNPVLAVGLGFVGFAAALTLQFRQRRYVAWSYWLAVVMVGVFGTMAADVLHVGFGVPYVASATLDAVVLAVVFVAWWRTEHTLSIHSIDTARREAFYWAAVCATFAMGTAVGDLTAVDLGLGYLKSLVVFAVIIVIPAVGHRWLRWNPILAFWFAYIVTRPLGASLADWLGKPTAVGGLGWGAGPVSAGLAVLIAVAVGYLTATGRDVQVAAVPRHSGQV